MSAEGIFWGVVILVIAAWAVYKGFFANGETASGGGVDEDGYTLDKR